MNPRLYSLLNGVWAMRPDVGILMGESVKGGLEASIRRQMADMDPARVQAMRALAGRVVDLRSEPGAWYDPTFHPHIRPSGVGVLPISGPQLDRQIWCYQGYAEHRAALKEFARLGVTNLVMPVDSPGGVANGALWDFCADLRTFRDAIPIFGVVECDAGSAACVILCQSSKVLTERGRSDGHLGVWNRHVDVSKGLTDAGVAVTYYSRGRYKVFFAEDIPKSAETDEVYEAGVERAWQELLDEVVAGRPTLTRETVASMEALIYHGADAVDVGLADGLGTLEQVLDALEG